MSAHVGRRFRTRGSVGALRSVVSFYNTSPGLPGKYPSHYFTEMTPPPQQQAIQFLTKEPIMKIPVEPTVPATPPHGWMLQREQTATPANRVPIVFEIDEGPRSSQHPSSSRTGTGGFDVGPTPSMSQSATRHRRNLRRLAGEPGLGGP